MEFLYNEAECNLILYSRFHNLHLLHIFSRSSPYKLGAMMNIYIIRFAKSSSFASRIAQNEHILIGTCIAAYLAWISFVQSRSWSTCLTSSASQHWESPVSRKKSGFKALWNKKGNVQYCTLTYCFRNSSSRTFHLLTFTGHKLWVRLFAQFTQRVELSIIKSSFSTRYSKFFCYFLIINLRPVTEFISYWFFFLRLLFLIQLYIVTTFFKPVW